MSGQTPWSQRESPFHIHLPAGRYSKTSSGVAPEQQIHGHHSASQGRRSIHDEAASHADMESPHEEQEKLLSDFDIDHDSAAAYQNATTPRSHAVSPSPFSVLRCCESYNQGIPLPFFYDCIHCSPHSSFVGLLGLRQGPLSLSIGLVLNAIHSVPHRTLILEAIRISLLFFYVP